MPGCGLPAAGLESLSPAASVFLRFRLADWIFLEILGAGLDFLGIYWTRLGFSWKSLGFVGLKIVVCQAIIRKTQRNGLSERRRRLHRRPDLILDSIGGRAVTPCPFRDAAQRRIWPAPRVLGRQVTLSRLASRPRQDERRPALAAGPLFLRASFQTLPLTSIHLPSVSIRLPSASTGLPGRFKLLPFASRKRDLSKAYRRKGRKNNSDASRGENSPARQPPKAIRRGRLREPREKSSSVRHAPGQAIRSVLPEQT